MAPYRDNICIIGVLEGEEKEKKKFLKITAEEFPYMGKETVTKSRKLRESTGRISPRRNIYIVLK